MLPDRELSAAIWFKIDPKIRQRKRRLLPPFFGTYVFWGDIKSNENLWELFAVIIEYVDGDRVRIIAKLIVVVELIIFFNKFL